MAWSKVEASSKLIGGSYVFFNVPALNWNVNQNLMISNGVMVLKAVIYVTVMFSKVTSAQVEFLLFAQIWTIVRLVPSDVTHVLFAWTSLDHTAAGVDPVTLATARLSVKVKSALHFRLAMRKKIHSNNVHNHVKKFRWRKEKQTKVSVGSLRSCLCPGTCFSRVPKTFWTRTASCQNAIRLFWKANLLTCFQCERSQKDSEVWWLRTLTLRR